MFTILAVFMPFKVSEGIYGSNNGAVLKYSTDKNIQAIAESLKLEELTN